LQRKLISIHVRKEFNNEKKEKAENPDACGRFGSGLEHGQICRKIRSISQYGYRFIARLQLRTVEHCTRERGFEMKEFKRILFPVDLSDSSTKMVSYVQTVAEKFESKIHIMSISGT